MSEADSYWVTLAEKK